MLLDVSITNDVEMNAEALKQYYKKVILGINELQKKLKTSKNLAHNIDRLQQSSSYMTSKMLHQKEDMVCQLREKIEEIKKNVEEEEEKMLNARETACKIGQIRQVTEVSSIVCH